MLTDTPPTALRLPAGFDRYQNPAERPLTVSSAQVKRWLMFWWEGVNADTYLEKLVKTGQLVPVKSPFVHKRMFNTEAVLTWAVQSGAAGDALG